VTAKAVVPRGLGQDGRQLYAELLAVHDAPADRYLVHQACVLADELTRIRRQLQRKKVPAARRDQLQVELRQQILVLDRLLNKLGRVTSVPRLEQRERFNIAKAAHNGGYLWQPEEWAAHAGHCPPSLPEKFIPTRLLAAARPVPDLCPPLARPKQTNIRQRLPATG
jgi:hypothetical protein